ncbi:MAG: hypothetical protein H0X30_03685 [Anaerolineae bacterium]|nr:hypothetical protein [Anaerolineae bacterium]
MTTTSPILAEWKGLKLPIICTVASLQRTIPPDRYSKVFWIAQQVENVITETCPLKNWFFTSDGRLIGEVDFAAWHQMVEIQPDEYVVLSLLYHLPSPNGMA